MIRRGLLALVCVLAACSRGEDESSCDELPEPEAGTGYLIKDAVAGGRWHHVTTLLEAEPDSGYVVGDGNPPIRVSWVIHEDRLEATDVLGPRFALTILEHVEVPRTYRSRPVDVPITCPLPPRPWYDRDLALMDWGVERVAAPDVLPVDSVDAPVPIPITVEGPTVVTAHGVISSLAFRASYRVTADCSGCEPSTVVVEHRFDRQDVGP